MSTYSTFAATGGADGPAGGGGGLVCGTTSYTVCADSNRSLAICLTCECPSGSVTLPNATSLSPGSPTYIIKNENTNTTYLLRDNTSCVLTSIPPGGAVDASLYDNSAQQGEWVIGKFTKPTPFNPVSDLSYFSQGELTGDDVTTECTHHDNGLGYSVLHYRRSTCCYKAVTFKAVGGEMVKAGEINGTVCKCKFNACRSQNGFVLFSCQFCQCGGALVDYAKFITAINCDSTCAVTFINCCAVGCCHNTGNDGVGDRSGKWDGGHLVRGTGVLYSMGILNCDNRCALMQIAKINTTSTGAPTCTAILECVQDLCSCSAHHCQKHITFCETNTDEYDRPNCCMSAVSAFYFGATNCICGEVGFLVSVKNTQCYYFARKGCSCIGNHGGSNFSGYAYFINDIPLLGVCQAAPSCTTQLIKIKHCNNAECNCIIHSHTSNQCGFVPIGKCFVMLLGCNRCMMDVMRIRCYCQNCICKHNLSQGSEPLSCMNMCMNKCTDAACYFVGMGCISKLSGNAWHYRNKNDGTSFRNDNSETDYLKFNDKDQSNPVTRCTNSHISPNPRGYTSMFFLTCDTADCVAGFHPLRSQTDHFLKFSKFHLSATHHCHCCNFCIAIPAAFQQASYHDQCICGECNGFRFWDCANCLLCSYNITKGYATKWCLNGAQNEAIVCFIGTTAGNSFAGATRNNCNTSVNATYSHSPTRFITTNHSQCNRREMDINMYNFDTFPGAVFCCIISKEEGHRPWKGGYSSDKCKFLLGSQQWICCGAVHTNTGIIAAIYNPSTNCFSSFDQGVADAQTSSFCGTDPTIDTITICAPFKLHSYIKGKS